MPTAPDPPCRVPTCPRRRPCPVHDAGDPRGTRSARGYTNAWLRQAAELKRQQPWCTRCLAEPTPGNPLTVDHVVPKARGGSDAPGNLQVLCRRCNSAKSTH